MEIDENREVNAMASIYSSTNKSSGISLLSAKTGFGGLVSGMDIDELVYSLTSASRQRILSQQQKVQKLQWKQEAYRSVTTALREFQSKYLDVLSATNFRSASLFNTVKASASSDAVTVSATANASAGSITIDSVTQLATSAYVKSAGTVSKVLTGGITGGTVKTVETIIKSIAEGNGLAAGDSFNIDLDGNVQTITLDEAFFEDLDQENFVSRLQALVDNAFGAGKITVSGSPKEAITFTAAEEGSLITLYSAGSDAVLLNLGFKDGQSSLAKPLTGGKTGGTLKTAEAIIAGLAEEGGLKAGDKFGINLDGKVRTITLNEDFFDGLDANNIVSRLQALMDDAFGSGIITVGGGGSGPLTFTPPEGSKMYFATAGSGSGVLTNLGFEPGQSNTLLLNASLEDLGLANQLQMTSDGRFRFTINNVDFEVKITDTLASVLNKINSSGAGVNISYSSITDGFTMTATNSGAGNTLTFSDKDGSNFLESLGLIQSNVVAGQNAILRVNGKDIVRTSNSFNIDGVDITLNSKPAEPVTITMTEEPTKLVETIKKFVEDYNSMVELANKLIKEKIYLDYQPLSDEQKEEMTESQIKQWEEKAKSGVLRGDSVLRSITSKLQSLMTGLSVNGFSLYSMGITSAGYSENGKLKIDEAKLNEALRTRIEDIKELFTSEKGLANQLNEIITGATKTSGPKGSRGILVEIAGVASTTSDTENSIYEQIKRANKSIQTLQSRLKDEETRLWNQFVAMETALQQLNAQSAMLTQFSSG